MKAAAAVRRQTTVSAAAEASMRFTHRDGRSQSLTSKIMKEQNGSEQQERTKPLEISHLNITRGDEVSDQAVITGYASHSVSPLKEEMIFIYLFILFNTGADHRLSFLHHSAPFHFYSLNDSEILILNTSSAFWEKDAVLN